MRLWGKSIGTRIDENAQHPAAIAALHGLDRGSFMPPV
jgi:hypothetical protein